MRGIARDLGEKLNTYAHVYELRRNWVSPFEDKKMYQLDQLFGHNKLMTDLHTISTPIEDIFNAKSLTVTPLQLESLGHGKSIDCDESDEDYRPIVCDKTFVGLVSIQEGKMKAVRLLPQK